MSVGGGQESNMKREEGGVDKLERVDVGVVGCRGRFGGI